MTESTRGKERWALLWSARDQIASNRRCEHRRGKCRYSSAILRDCECMQAAARRVESENDA